MDPLGFTWFGALIASWTWRSFSFPRLGKFSALLSCFLPHLICWDPCNANIRPLDVPEMLNLFFIFLLFSLVLFITRLPAHWWFAFSNPLSIPSGVFFIKSLYSFFIHWRCHRSSHTLETHSVSVCVILTLSPLSGQLVISIFCSAPYLSFCHFLSFGYFSLASFCQTMHYCIWVQLHLLVSQVDVEGALWCLVAPGTLLSWLSATHTRALVGRPGPQPGCLQSPPVLLLWPVTGRTCL